MHTLIFLQLPGGGDIMKEPMWTLCYATLCGLSMIISSYVIYVKRPNKFLCMSTVRFVQIVIHDFLGMKLSLRACVHLCACVRACVWVSN